MRAVYFDCFAGASGDMTLGALIDAGADATIIGDSLSAAGFGSFSITPRRVVRCGLAGIEIHATLPQVRLDADPDRFQTAAAAAGLDETGMGRAQAAFQALIAAESRVHGVAEGEVHFHELGNIDTFLDIVGVALALGQLGIEACYAGPLPAGQGTVVSSHGTVPLPVPAVSEIAAMHRAPLTAGPVQGVEAVTPTGAALLATLAEFEQPDLRPSAVGYGFGHREDIAGVPNALRALVGDVAAGAHTTRMVLVETNIDDMNPEFYAPVIQRLFDLGARDVWLTPGQMKKNRPATILSAIGPTELEEKISTTMLAQTSTLGVRVTDVRRYEAERRSVEFETSLGMVTAKVKRFEGRETLVPEFEECLRLSVEHGIPLPDVYLLVAAEGRSWLAQQRGSGN